MIEEKYQYFAFISYQRRDEEWAKWLQHKLEHYRLPSNLNGRTDLPKEIRPVFKDTSELTPGNLPEQIHLALEQSKFLIVICSPRSAQSEWVNKEVETFMSMGRTDSIIPFIIDGRPFSSNSEEECFPQAILSLPREQEILGANINEMGRDAAAVKVVARMFDIRFDELWQRHEREQKRHRMLIWASTLVLIFAITGVAFWMYLQRQETLKANWKMMENQSRMVAEKAKEEVRQGNIYDAILALLEMIPQDGNRPFVPELEGALRAAYDSLQNNSWNSRFLGDQYIGTYFSDDGNCIVGYKDNAIDIFESNSLRKKTVIPVSSYILAQYSYLSPTNDTLYIPDSSYVMSYHIPDGKLIKKEPYTESVLFQCMKGCHRRVYNDNNLWVNDFKKAVGLPQDVEIMDYNPVRKYLIYQQSHEAGGWYYLFDCKSKANIKSISHYKGQLIRYLHNSITDASFSPDGNQLAIALDDGGIGFVMDLNDFSIKPFDCGNESCSHFTNVLQFGHNGQLLHRSRFSITEIYDGLSLELMDTICYDHYKGIRDFTGNIYLAGADVYYRNKLNKNQSIRGDFDLLANYELGDILDTLINQRYHISCNGDKIHFHDSKKEYKEWTFTENMDEAVVAVVDFLFGGKYMLIVRESLYFWEADVIDVVSGNIVCRLGEEHIGNCFFYNKESEQLAIGFIDEDGKGQKKRRIESVIYFPSFDHLLSLCREATKGMVLTEQARRKFYLIDEQ